MCYRSGSDNALSLIHISTLEGKYIGRLSFFGAGAGTLPTGMNMMQDAMDILLRIGEVQDFPLRAQVRNDLPQRTYYVRGGGEGLPLQEQGDGWAVTAPVPVSRMHALSQEAAQAGHPIFFASMPERD